MKVIDIISPNRFSNISSDINKVVIKHISYVPRIHMDNIIMNYFLYSIFYLCMFMVLTNKKLIFLWQCELEEYDLLYFISDYHTDLLSEKFQPSIKAVD